MSGSFLKGHGRMTGEADSYIAQASKGFGQ